MSELWSQIVWLWQLVELRHIVDILIVAILVYEVLRLVHGTRAVQMAVGLALVGILYELSTWLGFAVIVLFQHEIRTALTRLGNNIRLPFTAKKRGDNPFGHEWYDEVVLAATTLASEKIGALMVFERDVGLKTYIESGIRLDAKVNYDLLVTIFNTHTPLHDGAVIISGNRVAAACCFLPLTQNPLISRELGTRHRAAIGVTEDSDAFAVIVSEETGVISFAIDGRLKRNLDGQQLRRLIHQSMDPWQSEAESEELEAEERKRDRDLSAVAGPGKREAAARAASAESVREETSV
jgi:diadenylate cyclase